MSRRHDLRQQITFVKAKKFSSMKLRKSFDLETILHILHINRYDIPSQFLTDFSSFNSVGSSDVMVNDFKKTSNSDGYRNLS